MLLMAEKEVGFRVDWDERSHTSIHNIIFFGLKKRQKKERKAKNEVGMNSRKKKSGCRYIRQLLVKLFFFSKLWDDVYV